MVTQRQSVFFFIGDDKYLKEEALKGLVSTLTGKSPHPPDQMTFYGGELDTEKVLSQLNTIPLLSDRRLVVIKDIEKVSDEFRASLTIYIKKPSKSAYLVLYEKDDSVLKEYDDVIGQINIRRFSLLSGEPLTSWIMSYVEKSGKTMDRDAIAIFNELEGNDLSYLSRELDKLITFAGDKREINPDDVEALIGKSLIKSAFDITDAIGRRNVDGAIKISTGLMAGGRKEYEIIGILSWYLKRLLKAAVLRQKGQSDYAIASMLKIGRKFQDEFFRQLARFGPEKIKSNIEFLLKADLDIKRSKFDPGTVLELMLVRLCLL
ncbi:MAG: DNA polymerase III subunit delta [Candidatus Omnitrophica bacterium]|nr:DNA polymerase III subunit delta [Candidatus Omnitrophota bacterium]